MKTKIHFILFFLLLVGMSVSAQTVQLNEENRDADYVKTICDRSQKIVDGLGLTDQETALNVRNVIANRRTSCIAEFKGVIFHYDHSIAFVINRDREFTRFLGLIPAAHKGNLRDIVLNAVNVDFVPTIVV